MACGSCRRRMSQVCSICTRDRPKSSPRPPSAGSFNVQDYARKVPNVLGPRAAPKSGTFARLNSIWRYIREAILATASALYGMRGTDAGIKKEDNRLGATATSLLLEAQGVQAWLWRVLDSWETMVSRFRLRARARRPLPLHDAGGGPARRSRHHAPGRPSRVRLAARRLPSWRGRVRAGPTRPGPPRPTRL